MSEKWKQTLTLIVEELDKQQYKKLLELLVKIPKSQKMSKSRENMPQIIIEHYGLDDSVLAIHDAMQKIPRRDNKIQKPLKTFVEKLKAKQENNTGKKRKRDPKTKEETEARDSRPVLSEGIVVGQTPTETDTATWRKSICELRAAPGVTATDTIRGRIIYKSQLLSSKMQKKHFFYLGVTDETASIRVMVYGKPRYQKLQKGKHYLFRKLKRDKNLFKVTPDTVVAEMSAFDIPKEVEEAGRFPSHSLYVSIEDVKNNDSATVSVKGIISEVCPSERIVVNQKTTQKQQFQIEDNTGSITVVIWGNKIKKCRNLGVGDAINLTDVKINKSCSSVTLQSISDTDIEQVHKVGIHNQKLKIVAVTKCQKRQTQLEVILDQRPHTMVVKSILLAEAYGLSFGKNFNRHLVEALPLVGEAQIEGNEIKAIQNIE